MQGTLGNHAPASKTGGAFYWNKLKVKTTLVLGKSKGKKRQKGTAQKYSWLLQHKLIRVTIIYNDKNIENMLEAWIRPVT